MLGPVDLVDEIEAPVRRHDAQRDGLSDRLAELGEMAARDLAQQRSHVDLAGEADQLRPEQDPIVLRDTEQQTLVLHRLDQAERRRSRQAGGARERRDARAMVRRRRRAEERDRLLDRLVQLGALVRRRHGAIVSRTQAGFGS